MKIVNQEVSLVDSMGSDLSVVNAARVSFNKESGFEEYVWVDPPTGETVESATAKGWPVRHVTQHRLKQDDAKLIKYLAKHNHWTPFGHTSLTFRIKAPIFVARQLGKHQVGLVWNEVSRRYVDDEPEFYLPQQLRAKAVNVKQGSSEESIKEEKMWLKYWEAHFEECLIIYQYSLNAGVCPEQARMLLPQSMMTEWIWTGSLAAFSRVVNLRRDQHTQSETREIANKIYASLRQQFPISTDALLPQG